MLFSDALNISVELELTVAAKLLVDKRPARIAGKLIMRETIADFT